MKGLIFAEFVEFAETRLGVPLPGPVHAAPHKALEVLLPRHIGFLLRASRPPAAVRAPSEGHRYLWPGSVPPFAPAGCAGDEPQGWASDHASRLQSTPPDLGRDLHKVAVASATVAPSPILTTEADGQTSPSPIHFDRAGGG